MKTTSILILCLTSLGIISWAATRTKATNDPSVAAKDPDFAIQGEYAATAKI